MNRENQSILRIVQGLAPLQYVANQNGAGIDLQGYDAATLAVEIGAAVDAGLQLSIEESDDDVAYAAAPADCLRGDVSLADQNTAGYAANKTYSFGYVGTKRYVRLVATIPGATNISASWILTHASVRPVNQNTAQI